MVKDFLSWVYKKIKLDNLERVNRIISEGQVFWCSLGENIGYEQNGKGVYFRRPVLIFKKFNNELFWGLPLSSKLKNHKFRVRILLRNKPQDVLLSQLRVLDSKRLDQFFGHVSVEDFEFIHKQLINLIKCKSEPFV